MTKVDEWVNRNWPKILIMLVSGAGAWFTLEAKVIDLDQRKVENSTFTHHVEREDSLKVEIIEQLREVRDEQRRVHLFLCQNQRTGLGCQ